MSICPGCGRCRQCGQPAPVSPAPVYPWAHPTWAHPTTVPYPVTVPSPWSVGPYYIGDVLPGQLGSVTVTC